MDKDRNQYVVGIVNVRNSLSNVISQEFQIGMPENVEIIMSYVPLEKVCYEGLMNYLDALPKAVDEFVDGKPDLIVVPSMTGSCIKGYEIVNMLEQYSGLPVIVPSIEMVGYLKELKKDKIAIVSAFGVELGLLEQLFFRNHGILVTDMISVFDNPDGNRELIDTIDNQLILEKVREADLSNAQVVVFDSPTYQLRPIIDQVKQYTSLPLLSVNQVLVLSTLKKLGLPTDDVPIAEYFV